MGAQSETDLRKLYLICALPFVYVIDFCQRGGRERGQRWEGAERSPYPSTGNTGYVFLYTETAKKKKQPESAMKNRQPLEHDNYASSLHNNYTCIGLCSNMSDYVRTFPIVF